jgi:hypothetical protein
MRKSFLLTALFLASFLNLLAFDKMEKVYAKVLRPAVVTFPARIQKIILADRTCRKCLHYPNGLRMYSGPDTSIYSTLAGLKTQLLTSGSYTVKMVAIDTSLLANDQRQLLPPLSWEAAARITENDPSALLIVLERQSAGYRNGVTIDHYVWRVYDPESKTLLDEYQQEHEYYKTVTKDEFEAGVIYSPAIYLYACHILPHWEWVGRDYYIEGSKKMKEAAGYVQQKDWDSAAALWNVVASDSANKTARSEACFNLAVYYEFAGDFDKALEWIALAEKLGDGQAAKYAPFIRKRKAEAPMTNAQYAAKQGQLPAPKEKVYLQTPKRAKPSANRSAPLPESAK